MKISEYANELTKKATPLRGIDDLEVLINSLKDKKIVMLGESSHGTKEFYEWRMAISKELILHHGFKFIAVEGDWPPCQEINKYIHKESSENAETTLRHFSRWPTWMWANEEVSSFIDSLKNSAKTKNSTASFYGLDVYSLYESMDKVVEQLRSVDLELCNQAIAYYSCFDSYRHDEKSYARSLFNVPEGCKKEVLKVLNETLKMKMVESGQEKNENLFNALQNSKIVANAENYYRAMVLGEEDSWNVRDHHMMDTLSMLLEHHGEGAKAIVWEHNTHIGDYRATDMALMGQVNIGGLARQKYGEKNVALVGFTTYSGSVIASSAWDGPIMKMNIPQSPEGSVEGEMHKAAEAIGFPNYYVVFDQNDKAPDSILANIKGHRAIGVVYYPPSEQRGNYVSTSLSRRYDSVVFIDQSSALHPIITQFDKDKIPETYPFGTHI